MTKHTDFSGLYLALFVVIFILLASFTTYLRYLLEKRSSWNSADRYCYAVQVLFGSRVIRTSQGLPTMPHSIIASNPHVIVDLMPHTVYYSVEPSDSTTNSQTITEVTVSRNRSGATDTLPCYDDVLLSDFCGNKKFPEVNPSTPETPPPSYEDNNIMKL